MDRAPCKKCGQVHQRCSAHKKRTDPPEPCNVYPGQGFEACRYHGGRGGKAKQKAVRRLAEEALEKDTTAFLATNGASGVQDPVGALEQVIAQNMGLVQAAGQRLNAAGDLGHEDVKGGLHAKVELLAYERGLDRAMRGLDLLIKHRPSASTEAARSLLATLGQQLGLAPDEDEDLIGDY